MARRKQNPLSISSDALTSGSLEVAARTEAPGRITDPILKSKTAHGAYGATLRAIVRAEWEAGESVSSLAIRHDITSRTIHRWKTDQDWDRSVDDASSAILEHARAEIKRKVEMQKVEVETAFTDVMIRHKAATATLTDMLHEAMGRALAYPHTDPFRQMLIIKVATEIAKNVQTMDRKTYEMDDNRTTKTTTAIFEVLDTMEDHVEAKAKKAEKLLPGGEPSDG